MHPRGAGSQAGEHTDVVWETASLGRNQYYLGRRAEAEPLALRVLAIWDSMADTRARKATAQLAVLYEGWGKPDRAVEFRQRARRMPSRSASRLRSAVLLA